MSQPEKSALGAMEGISASDAVGRRVSRLHFVGGSFFTDADGGAEGQCAMDAAVWRNLPEDMVWRVLHFVPAAKHFQWHLVSHKWQQVLTSGEFRSALASRQSEEQRMVAYVTFLDDFGSDDNSSTTSKMKVVDIDLLSMVPRSFWKARSQRFGRVVAAADGLVCIRNCLHVQRHCVLNPLTRMCKVLPQVPFKPLGWLPPTPTTITMFGYLTEDGERDGEVHVATYDLTSSGAGCKWDLAAFRFEESWIYPVLNGHEFGLVVLCAGETFWYRKCRVHVVAPRPGGRLVEIAVLDEPLEPAEGSALLMNPDPLPGNVDPFRYDHYRVQLVVHGGAVFFVKGLECWPGVDALIGVWRLARKRLEWEAVARVDAAEIKRLTGLECITRESVTCTVSNVCSVRESLYCDVQVTCDCDVHDFSSMEFKLGLNLDTGEWECVDKDEGPIIYSWPLELRPDLP